MPGKDNRGIPTGAASAYTMMGGLLVFGAIGYWLDKRSEGESYWLLAGLLLGVVVGMYDLGKNIFKK